MTDVLIVSLQSVSAAIVSSRLLSPSDVPRVTVSTAADLPFANRLLCKLTGCVPEAGECKTILYIIRSLDGDTEVIDSVRRHSGFGWIRRDWSIVAAL